MARLELKHVQLARIARHAADIGDEELYDRARAALVGCCDGSVGDRTPAPRPTPGVLPPLLGGLELEVRMFRWPLSVVEAADDANDPVVARHTLQHVREASQRNMMELIRASRAELAAGRGENAVVLYERALGRWARFGRQAAEIGRDAARANRNWMERWSDTFDEGIDNLQQLNPLNPSSPLTMPLIIGGLLALLYLK